MAVARERHAQVVEVPKDGSQGAQERHLKNHVVAVQWDGVAVDAEVFMADAILSDVDADIAG